MKYIFIIGLFVISLLARENPFMPVKSMDEDKIKATNIKEDLKDFEKQEIKLPNSARILKYITIGYQAIDGSIQEKKVSINQNINWHDSIFVTTNTIPMQPMPVKEIVAKNIETKKNVQKEPQIKKIKSKPKIKENSFLILKPYFSFSATENELILHAKDSLLRNFQVSKPYKLVFDFKRKSAFYTKTLAINKPPFKSVTIGAHESFYRTAFLLDGPYVYSLIKKDNRLIIKLK